MALNREQKAAVEKWDGHVCVVAGAGSGKTRVLTQRIVDMIKGEVDPQGILAFTFTKKAADEMRDRLEKEIGEEVLSQCFVGTIHSLFFKVIKEHLPKIKPDHFGHGIVIAKDWQQKKYLTEIHKKNRFNSEGMDEVVAQRMIGRAKNMGFKSKDLEAYLYAQEHTPKMIDYYVTCYKEYDRLKSKDGCIDFDDMLIMARDIFVDNPDILKKWQSKFNYISIDEYQDVCPIQEQLISMLQEPHGNLFVVGDARQSIYAFRASDPKFILDFKSKYPDAHIVSLTKNYRCDKTIMEYANALIAHNSEGKTPMVAASNKNGKVHLMDTFSTAEDEGAFIADEISAMVWNNKDKKPKWGEYAIVYRCNHQSRPIEDALIRNKIPYEILGSKGFYNRAEIKDMLAYLEIGHWGDALIDEAPFERIVNRPTRYLGKKFVEELGREKDNYEGVLDCLMSHNFSSVNKRSVHNVRSLWIDLVTLHDKKASPHEALGYIRDKIGYDSWWLENRGGEDMQEIEALANLNELSLSAANFKSTETMLNYVAEINRKYTENGNGNKVKLMSLHRAKGLEFPVVFMAGMSDAFLPHSRTDDITEERRLAYVGVTRAENSLYMSYYENVRDRIVGPSVFFDNMGLDFAEATKGDYRSEVAEETK